MLAPYLPELERWGISRSAERDKGRRPLTLRAFEESLRHECRTKTFISPSACAQMIFLSLHENAPRNRFIGEGR
jgi:hypothetical protein